MKANKTSPVFSALKALKQQLKSQQAQPPPAVRPTAPPASFETLLKQPPNPKIVSKTDKALFLQAVQGVQPLKNSQRQHLKSSKTKQSLQQSEQFKRRQQHALGHSQPLGLTDISDLYSSDYDELPRSEYLNPLCGTDVLRHLKQGRWRIMSSIDLHGSNLDQARLRLDYFLQHSLAEGFKCIRVVHGIGYGSKDSGPVLPTAVRRWLSQLDFVLAFSDCAPNEGGQGAVKVVLRTSAQMLI